MKTFISASDTFVKFVKEIDPSVKWLRDIKPEHFTKYMDSIRGLTSRTQVQYSTQLEKLDRYIKQDFRGHGFITQDNKFQRVEGWKSVSTRSDRALAYTEESRYRLEARLSHRQSIIEIASFTGLRKDELDQLRVRNIDFTNKTINVEDGKGGRERTIPLRPEIESRFLSMIQEKGLNDRILDVKMATVQREIGQVNKDNGFKGRNLHSFRHEYALREYKERYTHYRQMGYSRSQARYKARSEVSALLGHGKQGNEKAILSGEGEAKGRVSVTYEYITGSEGREIENEVEARL